MGRDWTDSGKSRDDRSLKQREDEEVRQVPCPPELTRLLREHLRAFGTDGEGRLFTGVRGGPLSEITARRAWKAARRAALSGAEEASALAATPYALRHTCVSTWLNAGVSETLVARWAGHSVAVLKRVYAKCLVGEEDRAMQRIEEALKPVEEENMDAYRPWPPAAPGHRRPPPHDSAPGLPWGRPGGVSTVDGRRTRQDSNLQPVIEGPHIELLPAHAKVRREGYFGSGSDNQGAGE